MKKIPKKLFLHNLSEKYGQEICHLNWNKEKPWTLLFAVILSAQCTDKRVNLVTPILFEAFPDLEHFVAKPIEDLEYIVKPTGFYRNKSKSLKKCAEQLLLHHNGTVPNNMEDLTSLAGVGRKTANVVLWNIHQKNIGFVVDTHIGRITQRAGFTKNHTPIKIEQDCMKTFPKKEWGNLSHQLIQFGRDFCKAPTPICSKCFFQSKCPKCNVLKSK